MTMCQLLKLYGVGEK